MSSSISVLTPARNEQSKIKKSATSVLRQLRKSDELIVYDDASTDDTLSILESIDDPRLRIIRGSKQVGTAMASNILLSEAKNEIIARLDADDYCLPGRFEKQRKLLSHSEYDMIFGLAIQKRGRLMIPQVPSLLGNEKARLLLPFVNPFVNSTLMTRKSTIDELGGCPEGYGGEDYSLFVRAAIAGKNLFRMSKYLVIREVPTKNEPKEARQRPWTEQLTRERTTLLRLISEEGIYSGNEDLRMLGDEEIMHMIESKVSRQNWIRKIINEFLG